MIDVIIEWRSTIAVLTVLAGAWALVLWVILSLADRWIGECDGSCARCNDEAADRG